MTIWGQGATAIQWNLARTIDVRSAKPVNPWGLHNIRGIAPLVPGDDGLAHVVTGSEDGNLTILRISDGMILSATVYNPVAQRGINSLTVAGNLLLVANCAVGAADSNLWCYVIDPAGWTIANTDKAGLKVDSAAAQVFNFDVVFAEAEGGSMRFLCSTEEGALWMGQVGPDGSLDVSGYERIGTMSLGSALCVSGNRLAATAYDLHECLIG